MRIFSKISITALVIVFLFSFSGSSPASAAATAVSLGTADSFVILAHTAITDAGAASIITGDVGLTPGTGAGITGLTAAHVAGTIYTVDAAGPAPRVVDPVLLTAADDALIAAYTTAAGQLPVTTVATELGGTTLTPGIYNSADGKFTITGTLTLNAQGDPDAVFIFKTASTLITAAAGSTVVLANSAQACKVFWQVGSSATIETGSVFKGNILAQTSATLKTGADVEGRVLVQDGAVTLDTVTITKPVCAAAVAPVSGVSRYGKINVVKMVINDNGRTKTVADFPLFVNTTPVVSGVTYDFTAPGKMYTVTETANSNYARTFSGDCDSDGNLNLNPGDNKFCIVTNDDIGAPVVVPPVPPLIDVVKVPSPLALPNGPGAVTYTYTLRNVGTVPVTDVTMVGDTCSPINLVSGDANDDSKLNVDETWVYRCSTTLSETHTNTVVATGWANGLTATDIASATVVVGMPIVPPLIHVTKIPSPLTLLAGGGMVTYTKRVTNPGTVALSNVRITDDKCSSVKYISGDTNGDSKLDTTETWIYTCRANLTKTTTNTAVASGEANGLTARDFAIATVVVAAAAPALPNTGIAPVETDTPWNAIIFSGMLLFALTSLVVVFKKRII